MQINFNPLTQRGFKVSTVSTRACSRDDVTGSLLDAMAVYSTPEII